MSVLRTLPSLIIPRTADMTFQVAHRKSDAKVQRVCWLEQEKAARRGCLLVAAKQVWKSLAQVLQSLLPKSAKCKRTREKQVTQVTSANDLCPEWLWESLKTWTLSQRPLQPTSPASACWKQKMFTKQKMLSRVLIKSKTSRRKTAQRGSTFLGPRKSAATPAISVWFAIHASCTCMAKTETKPRLRKIKWHQFVSPLHIVVCLLHSAMPDLQESNIAVYCSAFTKMVLERHLACICPLPNTLHTPCKICC